MAHFDKIAFLTATLKEVEGLNDEMSSRFQEIRKLTKDELHTKLV